MGNKNKYSAKFSKDQRKLLWIKTPGLVKWDIVKIEDKKTHKILIVKVLDEEYKIVDNKIRRRGKNGGLRPVHIFKLVVLGVRGDLPYKISNMVEMQGKDIFLNNEVDRLLWQDEKARKLFVLNKKLRILMITKKIIKSKMKKINK